MNNADKVKQGPQQTSSIECFENIKSRLGKNEAIAFIKPWALHYYSDRPTLLLEPSIWTSDPSQKMKQTNVDFLLVSINPEDVAIYDPYLFNRMNKDPNFNIEWRNRDFILFRKKHLNEEVSIDRE
jgi:hypothetical protein